MCHDPLKSPFRHHYELEHHGPPLWGFGQEDRKPEALGRSKAFQPLSLFNGWFKTGSSVGTLVPRPIFYIIVNRSNNKSGWDVNTQLINPSYRYWIQNLAMHESICLKLALVWIPRLRRGLRVKAQKHLSTPTSPEGNELSPLQQKHIDLWGGDRLAIFFNHWHLDPTSDLPS